MIKRKKFSTRQKYINIRGTSIFEPIKLSTICLVIGCQKTQKAANKQL